MNYRTKKRQQAIATLRAAGVDASDLSSAAIYDLMHLAGYRWRPTEVGYRWLLVVEAEVIGCSGHSF